MSRGLPAVVAVGVLVVCGCDRRNKLEEACTTDADCAAPLVCLDGVKVCVPTCRPDVGAPGLGKADDRCPAGWECTTSLGDRPVCAPLDRYRMTK